MDFWEYYKGTKVAPILTLFIGGNHEAWNHLQELPYGGWVCPNIYYIGQTGSLYWGDIHITGISGIYNQSDYNLNMFEKPPYTESTVRSIYHIKEIEIMMIKGLRQPIDIMISHDWPVDAALNGNLKELYRYKSYLK